MFKNNMKNNKIGQNDVNDESINKKAKNVNSNENNSTKQNNKSLENFLNYKSINGIYTIFSQQKFREKNITFGVKDNCKSQLYSGIMVSDLLANGLNRIYNKNDNEVKEYLKNHNITVKRKFWPKN